MSIAKNALKCPLQVTSQCVQGKLKAKLDERDVVKAGHIHADSFLIRQHGMIDKLKKYSKMSRHIGTSQCVQAEDKKNVVKAGHIYADSFLIRAPCFLYKGRRSTSTCTLCSLTPMHK